VIRKITLCGFAVLALSLFAADNDLKKFVRGEQPVTILARKEVARLPFYVRDQLLLAVSPEYVALSPEDAYALLRKQELENSTAAGARPLGYRIWYRGAPHGGEFLSKGKQYFTITNGPLRLTIVAGQFEKYVEVLVLATMAKDAKFRVNILPENVTLTEVRPRIVAGERATIKEVAKAVQHGAAWKSALVAGLGGMATRTVEVEQTGTVNGSYSGSNGYGSVSGSYSGRSTIREPDMEARANAQARAGQMTQEAQSRSAGVLNTALLGTTLGPGDAVDGYVYFKRDKAMKSSVVQVKVGAMSFEFPLEWK
jgi:hypothetical protein